MSAPVARSAVLVIPPLVDPTSRPHGPGVLDGAAQEAGLPPTRIIDANIGGLWFLAREGYASVRDAAQQRLEHIRTGRQTLPVALLLRFSGLVVPAQGQLLEAFAALRDPDAFFDLPTYEHSVRVVQDWMQCYSLATVPGVIDSDGFRLDGVWYPQFWQLERYLAPEQVEALSWPYHPYFEEIGHQLEPGSLLGVSCTYTGQLPFAAALIHAMRRHVPDVIVAVGGCAVSRPIRNRDDNVLLDLLDVDYAVMGEGESTWVELYSAMLEGREPDAPNLARRGSRPSSILYERPIVWGVSGVQPDEGYLVPEPVSYMTPSRGCYWNKCAFCDCGLNDGQPTSPWRQMSWPVLAEHVRRLSQKSRFVFFSVDVLAPIMMLRIAELVEVEGLDLSGLQKFDWRSFGLVNIASSWPQEVVQSCRSALSRLASGFWT